MPKVSNTPPALQPYLFHGLALSWEPGGTQATGACPWCGKEGKFSVKILTGVWKCWSCSTGTERGGGNVSWFLRMLWERGDKATSTLAVNELSAGRKLLYPETPALWGVARNPLTAEWILPGYDREGQLVTLYKYVPLKDGGRYVLLATPTLRHGLLGRQHYTGDKPIVYLCEGPWDGMTLWEVLRSAKPEEDAGGRGAYCFTASEASSLYAGANVLAVPGAGVLDHSWLPLFAGKHVFLLYDNDPPREQGGKPTDGAGLAGMRRAAFRMADPEHTPRTVQYLAWGGNGYDPALPSGYDVRDALAVGPSPPERVAALSPLLARVKPIPEDWMPGRRPEAVHTGGTAAELIPCSRWSELVTAWKKALRWTEGLDATLSVMLAAVSSTRSVGDQLWIKVIGPPSCGKSVLCEALSTNREHVLPKSTIRGFHSGFQSDREGKEDNSLLAQLKNKTLVTKDGDTLLQAPNRDQILSEARDVYDRNSRTHYRNRQSRDYEGVNMTWILCGTESLRALDSSELGERFLDCVVVDEMSDELEDEIGWRVVNRAARELLFVADGRPDTRDGPELVRAKGLTGGYVAYLATNVRELLSGLDQDSAAYQAALRRCYFYGKFVACMRARPPEEQEERSQREMSFRLASQHVRLAHCLAVVLNRPGLDGEVLRRVRKVAMDTARGHVLRLVKLLEGYGSLGATTEQLALVLDETPTELKKLLKFLAEIRVVAKVELTPAKGIRAKPRAVWQLTRAMAGLYRKVLEDPAQGLTHAEA